MGYKRNITFEFMVGLPGSGKSTIARDLEAKNKGQRKIIDFDKIFESSGWKRAKEGDRIYIIRSCIIAAISNQRVNHLILDGLFLTYDDIVRVIESTCKMFSSVNIIVRQWNEDREICMKNDGGRREVPSTNTILHAKYEQIDRVELEKIIREVGCENVHVTQVIKHDVILKPDWDRYFRGKTYIDEDGRLRSDKWCAGGSYGNCWDDSLSPISADDQPEFDILDNLLGDICPTITFLHYKKIMRNCVEIEDTYESDYYGGGCNYKNYVCDVKQLYDMLKEFGYIVE